MHLCARKPDHFRFCWSSLQVIATHACTHILAQVLAGQGYAVEPLLGSNPSAPIIRARHNVGPDLRKCLSFLEIAPMAVEPSSKPYDTVSAPPAHAEVGPSLPSMDEWRFWCVSFAVGGRW